MKSTVLVVEDEVNLAQNIMRYLEKAGHVVRAVNDGESALLQYESFKPDLIVLDLKLPGIDGIETLFRLRKRNADVKVVIMTAYGDTKTADSVMKAGALEYLNKPIVLSELKQLVARVVQQGRTASRPS